MTKSEAKIQASSKLTKRKPAVKKASTSKAASGVAGVTKPVTKVSGVTGRRAYAYDVCLSFAGEARTYVEQVARRLKAANVRVFYDTDEKANLWGKDLYTHLDEIYRLQARYCVLFASKWYAEKRWTAHERQSAQARTFMSNREYILPARFDDTAIPGLRPTVGYIDLRKTTAVQLAKLIIKKLHPGRGSKTNSSTRSRLNTSKR